MSKAKDSSFLDPKLQLNLSKSLRVQSKMRAPASQKEIVGDSRKSIFTQGINLRSTRSSAIISNNDVTMIRMIKKLVETEGINDNLVSMLTQEDLAKLNQIKNAKLNVNNKKATPDKDKSRISSQRKARNLFKEDLLYSTGKKVDQVEEIDEIQDYDQIIHAIEELKVEKTKLTSDINKCEQFIHLKSSSSYFRFKYLLTKLHYIRKCTQLGNVTMLTADYFSVVLDNRKAMMELVAQEMTNIQNTMDQINALRGKFDNEITGFLNEFELVDSNNRLFAQQCQEEERAMFIRKLPSDRKLDMLDEKLALIIKTFRERAVHNAPKKMKEKEKSDIELKYDPAVTAEDVARSSAKNLEIFKDNVSTVMQRCFQMTEGRLQRLETSRKVLLADRNVPQSDRILHVVEELQRNTVARQESLVRMVELERQLRLSAEQAFEDRTRSLLSAVAQSEQVSINHLKAHYHNLYAKSTSRNRRRSTVLL